MRFIDNHCHLFHEYFPSYDDYINKANNVNVTKIIVSGTDKKSNQEVLSLISKYEGVYGSIGFHPNELEDLDETSFALLESQLKTNKKIVGIGEIGLDYHYDNYNKNKQIELFKRQIDIANLYNKPIIIHCRDSINDAYNILENVIVPKILHCYSGSLEMASRFIKNSNNVYFGVGGVVTFKNSKVVKDVVKNIPLSKIVFETDSPYLSPEPYRGSKNEPKNIKFICDYVSSLRGLKNGDVQAVVEETVRSIFDI